jgi:hypothetical protein
MMDNVQKYNLTLPLLVHAIMWLLQAFNEKPFVIDRNLEVIGQFFLKVQQQHFLYRTDEE